LPTFPRVNFARLLVDRPEEESPDQVLLTGKVLAVGSQEISSVVGPLREVDRLLKEAGSSPRQQHLGMLFKDLLESTAYVYSIQTAEGSFRRPTPPLGAGELIYCPIYSLNPVLLDDLRQSAHTLLAPERSAEDRPEGEGSGRPCVVEGLKAEDLQILQALEGTHPFPMSQEALELRTGLRVRTIGPRLKFLREKGFVCRPSGDKDGDTITEAGLGLLPDK
jgi:hypothetical protein